MGEPDQLIIDEVGQRTGQIDKFDVFKSIVEAQLLFSITEEIICEKEYVIVLTFYYRYFGCNAALCCKMRRQCPVTTPHSSSVMKSSQPLVVDLPEGHRLQNTQV
jgi:hypothetical protein